MWPSWSGITDSLASVQHRAEERDSAMQTKHEAPVPICFRHQNTRLYFPCLEFPQLSML